MRSPALTLGAPACPHRPRALSLPFRILHPRRQSFYSFAAAFHILFRLDQKDVEEFNSFLHTTGTM
jgi:hypothetical protein